MKLLSILFTAILVAASAAHTCNCAGTSYNNSEIVGAINKGYSKNKTPTTSSRAYPHRFGNREKLNFKGCKEGTLVEYPLKKSKKPWDGESPPGADRVVYLEGEDKKFCGCMTHTGAGGNNFVKCK